MAGIPALYNNLGDVYEAAELVGTKPEALKSLARLLAAHGLDEAFDIRLNHKHFDISGDEQVVSFRGHDMLVSAVCTGGEPPAELLAANGIQPTPGAVIQPSDFVVRDGEAFPYEFTHTTTTHPTAMPSQFLSEWSAILHQQGLDGLLGLSVRDDVPLDAHEVADPDNRINRLYFGKAPADGLDVVSTTWRVHEVDGVIEAKQCSYCSAIREHGKKCGSE